MKKLNLLIGTLLLSAGLASCTSAYYASGSQPVDDLYGTHNRVEIAKKQTEKANAQRAAAEARKAEWDARIAEARAQSSEDAYYSETNPYTDILADTYESAYARRMQGFDSPSYRMPSSYYNFVYSSTFNYATAYDPALYNIVISGDQVWVEPRYITSMFGSWGGSIYSGGWYNGWSFGSSHAWWGYPRYSWYDWNWGFSYRPWYDPWYNPCWGPSWNHHGHGNYWGNNHSRPHNYRLDSPGRGSDYRYGSSSGRGNYSGRTGTTSNYRPGSTTSNRNPGSSTSTSNGSYGRGSRGNNSSSVYNGGSRGSNSSSSSSGRNDGYNSNSGSSSGRGNYGGRESSGSSNSGGSRESSYGSGSSSSSSSGSYSGGSRGGSSSGSSDGGGSRGGSAAGGRGYGGR